MKYKTIIVEEKPTPNNRIYIEGSLIKIKEILQPYIEKNICFVVLGADRDAFLKYSGQEPDVLHSDKAIGLYCGVVKSFEIEDGQGLLDIHAIETTRGNSLKAMEEFGVNFKVDFDIKGTVKLNDEGFALVDIESIVPVVILRHESNN